jgi:hypothetical protein
MGQGCRRVNIGQFETGLRTLQHKGFEVEVIGRGDRLLDLQRKPALGRFIKRLLLTNRRKKGVVHALELPVEGAFPVRQSTASLLSLTGAGW